MNRFVWFLFILFMTTACKKEYSTKIDVSQIQIDFEIDRFEKKFFSATSKNLNDLKRDYPYLFPEGNHDSIWLNRIKDSAELVLFDKSEKEFDNLDDLQVEILNLFKHIKFYHQKFSPPKIITLISDLDYQSKIIYADSLLFVSLDLYLGAESEVYQEFPNYLSRNFKKSQIPVDIAMVISERVVGPIRSRQFLDIMVSEGKKHYLIDQYLPEYSQSDIMGYSTEDWAWLESNEAQIWKYFIENRLLYSTDTNLYSRFIENAPFSKFYIDIDKDSPGRVGVWLGWQIVNSYMRNNNVTLPLLMQKNAEDIFKNSKYKPKK